MSHKCYITATHILLEHDKIEPYKGVKVLKMNNEQNIDVLAHCSKLALELVPMEEKKREWAKVCVDLSAEMLKHVVHRNDESIQRIRLAAQQHGLERVTAFPCVIQGQTIVFLRMNGGTISDFCQQIGIQQIAESTIPVSPEYLVQTERQCSIVLYDRNRQ